MHRVDRRKRQMFIRVMIKKGCVFIALPPLYRINAGKETYWTLDDRHKARILKKLPPRVKPEITRFKGLGEMNPKTLYKTTLDPELRRIERVTLRQPMEAENMISRIMGKDPSQRYQFIVQRAEDAEGLDY